jgi:hypothetical protein
MKLAPLVLLALLCIGPAAAQNSDIGILFSAAVNRFDLGSHVETQYRVGLQVNYARQLLERRAGRLYLELPINSYAAPFGQGVTRDLGYVHEIARPERIVFVTPGIRYHLYLKPRLAVYASVGAGVAIRQQKVFTFAPLPEGALWSPLLGTRIGWKGSVAGNVGAGLDFRLTRLLSLRAEFRSFRTTSVPGFGTGRQYPTVHAGLGFHF